MSKIDPESPEQEYTSAELEAIRQKAEHLLQEAAERVSSPLTSRADPVTLNLDWVPCVADGCITFQLALSRGGRHSAIDFTIDLKKLDRGALETFSAFLSQRHAGLTNVHDMGWHLAWMLDCWLRQRRPELPLEERQATVRRLLLC